ncbi:PIN domain-containing protein [Candidatus Bathyarchaeota archaeon]|nr:PIN domain-containing protein [Candidatus Bathyarchaeota archaeon]
MSASRKDRVRVHLDTTYLLPFLGLDIELKHFTLKRFEGYLSKVDEMHLSEISVYEAKAKIHRLASRTPDYAAAHEGFGDNLKVLQEDEKVRFHRYTPADDVRLNFLYTKTPDIDFFDAVIVAQAAEAGLLLTEDHDILSLRGSMWLDEAPWNRLKIINWSHAITEPPLDNDT